MTKSTKKILLYLAVFLPVTIVTVALRTLALLLELDESGVYFKSNIMIGIAAALSVAFAVFAVSFSFDKKCKVSPAASFVNPQTYIPSGLAAVSLVFVAKELFFSLIAVFEKSNNKGSNTTILKLTLAAAAILSVFCIISFFLNVFFEKRNNRTRAAFTMSCVAFLAIYSIYLFFSENLPLNAPNKATDQIAFISLSIFFLYETRISLGRPIWKLYVSFGLIAANLAFFSSIPSLIYYFVNGAADSAILSAGIPENVLAFVLGIYVLCRLWLVMTLVPDETCQAALAIEKMAKARIEEINSSKSQDENKPEAPSTDENLDGSNYEIEIPTFMNTEDGAFGEDIAAPENNKKD